MRRVIALCGGQGSGKTTLAKYLVDAHGFTKISFADPIYAMMSSLLRGDARALPKEEPLEALGGKTLRHALQTLGTEWGRAHIGDDIWVSAAIRNIQDAGADVVIDDVRFLNEYEALLGVGAEFYKIHRVGHDSVSTDSHASEQAYSSFEVNEVIYNIGSSRRDFISHALSTMKI